MKFFLVLLSFFFVFFSFSPSLYEIYHIKDLPKERSFVLEHNYMFDYNFYLSRIRQGQEGRWLVVEKYFNKPHRGSLFQELYLILGKIGQLFNFDPPLTYHSSRLIFGLIFLLIIAKYLTKLFPGWWQVIAFLFVVTCGSWPIAVKGSWRFATYMGWWSAVDSLQRITFMPHILLGQIFILIFICRFSGSFSVVKKNCWLKSIIWGLVGFVSGIVFPPTLLVVYTSLVLLSLFELIWHLEKKSDRNKKTMEMKRWIWQAVMPRLIFILLSLPSFIYIQLMFSVWPWRALALFDIQHRFIMPYREYALALGPILPLGLLGGILAMIKKEKRLIPLISWIVSLAILFLLFENIPQQSPLRFTEAAINIPLGILATYLLFFFWSRAEKFSFFLAKGIKFAIQAVCLGVIVMGLLIMVSMVSWLTDQAYAKRVGTFLVPTGTQLIYPLKDFMEGIYFIKNSTKEEEIILAFETAGNYIPAYAGNFVYFGHANTPFESEKKAKAAEFFSGKMTLFQVEEFLKKENISYVYFGVQEKELGHIQDLSLIYPILKPIYTNNRVVIYKVVLKNL